MGVKKTARIDLLVPKEIRSALENYMRVYDREICRPRGQYTDMSKLVRAIIVAFLMKKGLIGREFQEYLDPCYSERVVEPTPQVETGA